MTRQIDSALLVNLSQEETGKKVDPSTLQAMRTNRLREKSFRTVDCWAICNICHSASLDGVGPIYDARLVQHLATLGITPKRNANGWIVWPR